MKQGFHIFIRRKTTRASSFKWFPLGTFAWKSHTYFGYAIVYAKNSTYLHYTFFRFLNKVHGILCCWRCWRRFLFSSVHCIGIRYGMWMEGLRCDDTMLFESATGSKLWSSVAYYWHSTIAYHEDDDRKKFTILKTYIWNL